MSAGVASLVARSVGGDPAERRRRRLLAAAVGGCSAFGIAGVVLAAVRGTPGETCADTVAGTVASACRASGLAPYVREPGLRAGVVVAAILLVVPFAVLAVQVLRLGSQARERRLAALRIHGATSGDLRRIAAAEVRGAATAGAAAGLPGYLALWLVAGVLPPDGWRLLPAPGGAVLAGWPVVGGLLVLGALVAARRAVPAGDVDLLGLPRRRPRPLGRAAAVVTGLLGAVLLAGLALVVLGSGGPATPLLVLVLPLVFVALAVAVGPWLVVVSGRRLAAGSGPVAVLAGRRLLADPRTPGRVAGVLLAVGLAVGFAVADLLGMPASGRTSRYDWLFYGGAVALALAGIALAAVVAIVSLVVGAAEQVLDARRPTAALVALGASPGVVRGMVRTQLRAASVLPAALGAFVGSVLLGTFLVTRTYGATSTLRLLLPVVVAGSVALAALVAVAGSALAGALLRRTVEEATSVENLRTA